MSQPKLSVVIPTFNAGATIAKAIESILAQSFTGYEVLIMDGLSKDDTLAVIKGFAEKDDRIKWTSQKDEGIYDAMNKAIPIARGEWIIFLGGDDSFFSNDVFEKVMRLADTKKDTRMIYGNVQLNKLLGFNYDSLVYGGEFHPGRLIYANICHQCIFYHHSLFKELGGFTTKYKLLADWDFNLRCFSVANAYYFDIIVSNFFVGASSAADNDDLFKKDLIKNMVFRYPYSYRHQFFRKTKKALSHLLIKELRSFRVARALKVSRVLFYQLKPSHT